ncbi:unnamed protein product [Effrenium voratum]|uniref:Glycolipid transfer protein domain-containing protein n=1 Tax=Effrenium voratum TaxID=2562239 RepID=A0AA36IUA2_9DINO|nr:unnamed protein product [Effrenium voratum]
MSVLRSKADPTYLLAVRGDSLADGGWVGLVQQGDCPQLFVSWEVSEGTLRPKANPRFALSLAAASCQDGGWVQLAEHKPSDVLQQWMVGGGGSQTLRARQNPGFVLCVRRDFQGLHIWSFDGLPDQYGQWEIVASSARDPRPPLAGGTAERESAGVLRPVLLELRSAACREGEALVDLHSERFVRAMQSLVLVLQLLGWRVSDLLDTDTEKLVRFWAKAGKPSYRDWLLSETDLHAETGYQEYVDDSLAMANLWLARNLSFFVELFDLLADGFQTPDAVNVAYSRTLQEHHSFLQRQAFFLVFGQLKARESLLQVLEGEVAVGPIAVEQEMLEMADLGRRITDLCFKLDREMSRKIQAEQSRFEVDEAYGKRRTSSLG